MVASGVTISGDKQLFRALKRLHGKELVTVLNGGLRAGAKPMLLDVQENTPEKSGALRESMGVQRKTDKKSGSISIFIGPRRTFKRKESGIVFKDNFGAAVHQTLRSRDEDGNLVVFLKDHLNRPKRVVGPQVYAKFIETGVRPDRRYGPVARRKGAQRMLANAPRNTKQAVMAETRVQLWKRIKKLAQKKSA